MHLLTEQAKKYFVSQQKVSTFADDLDKGMPCNSATVPLL